MKIVDSLIQHFNIFVLGKMVLDFGNFHNKILKIFVLITAFTTFTTAINAEGWNGIYPLKSSRGDVVKILGKCQSTDSYRCLYESKDKNIIVYYTDKDCSNGGLWNVPKGSVESVEIHFKKNLKPEDLRLDKSKFTVQEDPELDGVTHYNNKDRGIYFVVGREKLRSIYFSPTKEEEKSIRCSAK